MVDPIDRKALKAAMYHRAFETDNDTMWQSGCWVRYRAIEQVIDAQPSVERKKGKWINSYDLSGNQYKRCSECGVRIEITFFANDYSVIFCPNCGADMREDSNGES